MGLCDDVRAYTAEVVASARHVHIDQDALAVYDPGASPEPSLDPLEHFLEGRPAEVSQYLLTLDTINFGSG